METISVTRRHINRGTMLSPVSCPVALAIREQLEGRYDDIRVTLNRVTLRNKDKNEEEFYPIDEPTAQWIHNFDNGKEAKPFTLNLFPDK